MAVAKSNDRGSVEPDEKRMTCVKQSRKLKSRVCEDGEQDTETTTSLVDTESGREKTRPASHTGYFSPGLLNTCPYDEWRVSPVMSNGDITMQAITTVTNIGSIGNGNYPLKLKVTAWEVGA